MVDQARVEAFVVQVGVARGLITRAQLQAAQSTSGGSVLARLNPQLTPESRSALQALYHQALASEQQAQSRPAPPSGGTFSAEKTQAPSGPREGGFHGNETYMSGISPVAAISSAGTGPAPEETYLGSRGSASVAEKTESGRILAPEETYAGDVRRPSDRLSVNDTYASFAINPTRSGGSEIAIDLPPSEDVTRAIPPPASGSRPVRVTGPAASARTVALPDETAQARPAAKVSAGPAPKVGDRVGSYETIRELGRGGMGIVYEARDTRTGDQVALKLMIVTRKTTGDDVERFKIEAKAALKLDHPNLVRVFEQGVTDEGHWYTAMEYVEGEDLDAKMKREGVLDSEDAALITLDLADALAYAHEQSILHRDIKPQNVMIDSEGVPRLTDFGLAKLRDDDAKTSLTASGTLLGTPAYMSPEQAEGMKRDVDERSDVYCLGATLYHMLTGKPPFERPSLTSLLLAITGEKPVAPTQLVDDVDRDLETIVLKCLEKDREARYQSMRALARDLNRWSKALDIVAKRPSPWENFLVWARANRPLVAVSSGAAIVVLATLAFAFSRGPGGQQVAASPTPEATPADTPAKTEDPPPTKTEDPPPAKTEDPPPKTEDPPAKTEAKTEDPPAKTEDPPPAKTEDPPPAKTEDPPVPETPRTASGKVLPAAQPPTWLVRRLDHMRKQPGVLYVSGWQDAVQEAGARKAPILLANLHHTHKQFTSAELLAEPAQVQRVNASCVFVIAQFRHPPGPGGGGPKPGRRPGPGGRPGPGPRPDGQGSDPNQACPFYPMKCVDHERIQSRTVEPPWGEIQLRIYGSRGQQVLAETANQKTQHQGNAIFSYSEAGFAQALKEARGRTGALLDPLDLRGAGLDLSKADADQDRSRAELVYARYAERPGLLGSWARYRLRELCRAAIGEARGSASQLRALRARFAADAGCSALIDDAL